MPRWHIEQYELHCQGYEIEAPTAAEAIKKLLIDGEGEADDNGSHYLDVEEEHGIPIKDEPELAEALQELDVSLADFHIPSIRRVLRVDETGD